MMLCQTNQRVLILPGRSNRGLLSYSHLDNMSVTLAAPTAPSLAALTDPQPRLVDSSAMHYFLIEAVQTLRHSSAVADARAKKIEDEMIEAGLIPPPQLPQIKAKKDAQRDDRGRGRGTACAFGSHRFTRGCEHYRKVRGLYPIAEELDQHSKTVPWPCRVR
jgi:hypothetical protein